MKIVLLFLVITLGVFAKTTHRQSNPFSMDYEAFVHLSDQEKNQIIIKTMELIVELEERYPHRVTQLHQENFKKAIVLLHQLQSWMIDGAHAQEEGKKLDQVNMYKKFANDFSEHIKGQDMAGKKTGCIFAGWVSKMKGGYCVHPLQLSDSDPIEKSIKEAYKQSSSKQCPGVNVISCNPMVFGFKNGKDPLNTKLFCVSTVAAGSSKQAHNSSYECMRDSLGYAEVKGADTKEERLKLMKDLMTSPENKESFNFVQKHVFQTCVCNKENPGLNDNYKTYIRPHRTCFGLMNSIREMNGGCDSPIYADDFFTIWTKHFTETTYTSLVASYKGGDFDKKYFDLIKADKTQEEFCKDEKEPVLTKEEKGPDVPKDQPAKPTCKLTAAADEKKENINVSVTFEPEQKDVKECTWSPEPQKDSEESKSTCTEASFDYTKEELKVGLKVKIGAEEIECPEVTFKDEGAKPEDDKKEYKLTAKGDAPLAGKMKAHALIDGEDKIPAGYRVVWIGPAEVKAAIKVKAKPKNDVKGTDEKDPEVEKQKAPEVKLEDVKDSLNHDGLNITVPQGAVAYKICAVLMKGNEKKSGNECVTIPPIVQPQMPMQQQGMQGGARMPRQQRNTSMGGAR